jgi:hypothetical protein
MKIFDKIDELYQKARKIRSEQIRSNTIAWTRPDPDPEQIFDEETIKAFHAFIRSCEARSFESFYKFWQERKPDPNNLIEFCDLWQEYWEVGKNFTVERFCTKLRLNQYCMENLFEMYDKDIPVKPETYTRYLPNRWLDLDSLRKEKGTFESFQTWLRHKRWRLRDAKYDLQQGLSQIILGYRPDDAYNISDKIMDTVLPLLKFKRDHPRGWGLPCDKNYDYTVTYEDLEKEWIVIIDEIIWAIEFYKGEYANYADNWAIVRFYNGMKLLGKYGWQL